MTDKPVLVSATWAHTIFIFFEYFLEDVSHSKLCKKKKIIFFGSTDQKLWTFEILRRNMGRAGMCWREFPLQSFEPCSYTWEGEIFLPS